MAAPPLLLRIIGRIVPSMRRDDWIREWHGEIHYSRNLDGQQPRTRFSSYLRLAGALEDAVWLRWRHRGRGMLIQDVKYGIRGLGRQIGFTTVVILTLALGIGANTAIFTLVDAVLLRPLPVDQPSELVDIYTTCRRGFPYCSSSYPDFLDYRQSNRALSDMAAFAGIDLAASSQDEASLVGGLLVTGTYFEMLGVHAALGRMIIAADDRIGNPRAVAVLSHRVWQRDYGSDPAVLGHDIRLNGAVFTIIGVAPPEFRGTRLNSVPDLWIPFSTLPLVATGSFADVDVLSERAWRWIGGVIGRKRAGLSLELTRADLIRVSDQIQEEFPRERGGRTVTVEATRAYTLPASTRDDIVRFVTLLLVVVAVALLIACANIANLLLARATARRREIGVRIALGASRGRLVRQLLTESLVLSVAGAGAGLFVASLALRFLSEFALPGFVAIDTLGLRLDPRVLAFTGILTVFTGLLFGLVPALQTTSPNVTAALKEQLPESSVRGTLRTRGVLLALQTAMALTLLVGAALFVRSLQNGLRSDVGFETRNLAIASFDLGMQRYEATRAAGFIEALTQRTAQFPGVRAVTSAVYPPLAQGGSGFFVLIDGYDPVEGEELRIEANWVGPDYFRAMGIPLLAGRDFEQNDREGAPLTAVINETMARRWFTDVDPVGRMFKLGGPDDPDIRIVGVAGDVKYGLTEDPEPFVYFSLPQYMDRALNGAVNVLVVSDAPALQLLPEIRAEIRNMDPDLVLQDLSTLENRFAEFLMPQRMGSTLLSTLGALTVLLAIVGITGIVGYAVNQRRREIGIRIALGASSAHVVRVMVRGALVPIGAGLALGIVASLATTRLVANFMYDVAPTDAVTFVTMPLLMTAVAIVAAYLPARRAVHISPTESLRGE